MYCSNCGQPLAGDEKFCSACGAKAGTSMRGGLTAAAGEAMGGIKDAIGSQRALAARPGAPAAGPEPGQVRGSYEYVRTTVKGDLAQVATDCYESLGFELTGQRTSAASSQATLAFRRSRKVRNKAQLSKIQRTMDDLIASIAELEESKSKRAMTQALTIGIVAALVLGLGMSCVMVWGTTLMAVGIVLGLIGIGGCLLAWMRYRKVYAAETARVNPRIDEAYDRLATACEEAQALLRSQA